MKTVSMFLLGAIIGVGALYLFHKFAPQEAKTSYLLDLNITDGKRVPLKDGVTVRAFENQLQAVDQDGKNGTNVNIKSVATSPDEVEGPLANGAFEKPNRLLGPTGSIHNTQKIAANTMAELQSVLDLLASSSAAVPSTATPTPTPSP